MGGFEGAKNLQQDANEKGFCRKRARSAMPARVLRQDKEQGQRRTEQARLRECPEDKESVTRMNARFPGDSVRAWRKCKQPGMEKAGKLLSSATQWRWNKTNHAATGWSADWG